MKRRVSEPRTLAATDAPPSVPQPADPSAVWLTEKATGLLDAGCPDEALPYLERLLSLAREPEVLVWAHYLLGEHWRDRDELGRSTHHFRAAAEIEPGRASLHYQLGLAHAHQENAQAAAESLRRALELAPDDAEVLRALGVALSSLGEDAEAARLLTRALRAAPREARVLESIATLYLKLGRFADCAEVLEKASELEPENRMVRRLTREAGYLVELSSQAPPQEVAESGRTRLRVALDGAPGEVERLFVSRLQESGFSQPQLLAARDLWRDFLAVRRPRLRDPRPHAAAVHHALARLDFVDGCALDAVAMRYEISEPAVERAYQQIVETLDLAVFDPRYCSQPHPVEQVEEEARAQDLGADEVLRAILEDEYREYEETHSQEASELPRLDIDEYEDASIEYGALLTREMMGLTLGKRERRRKRELERMLLVKLT